MLNFSSFYNYFADFFSRVCRSNRCLQSIFSDREQTARTGTACHHVFRSYSSLLNVVTNVVMTSAADNAVGRVDSYSVFVVLNTVLATARYLHADHPVLLIYFLCRRGMNRKKADREDEYSGCRFFALLWRGIRRLRTARIHRARGEGCCADAARAYER